MKLAALICGNTGKVGQMDRHLAVGGQRSQVTRRYAMCGDRRGGGGAVQCWSAADARKLGSSEWSMQRFAAALQVAEHGSGSHFPTWSFQYYFLVRVSSVSRRSVNWRERRNKQKINNDYDAIFQQHAYTNELLCDVGFYMWR